jgi:hypothetical protein
MISSVLTFGEKSQKLRRAAIPIGLLLIATWAGAQERAGTAGTGRSKSTEQQLVQVKYEWGKAYVQHDAELLDRILAPDYSVTDDSGHTKERAEVIADFKAGEVTYETTSYDDVKVRIYGAVAIVAGRGAVKGRNARGGFHREYFSTNVFVKRGGRWQAVATHISGVRSL